MDAEVKLANKEEGNLKISIDGEPSINNGITSIKLSPQTGALLEVYTEGVNGGKNLVSGDENLLIKGYNDFPEQYPAWNIMHE